MEPQVNPVLPAPNDTKKWWIVGGAVVAIIVIVLFMRGQSTADRAGGPNSLIIGEQDPDSVAVLVGAATVQEPSFIVIHKDNAGKPGAAVATGKLLTPGSYGTMSVIMPLTAGETYYGMLHADDGNGIYSADADHRHLKDEAGAEVIVPFSVRMSSSANDSKG